MRPSNLPEIRDLPLFRDMALENYEALMQGAYAQIFPTGLELIHQGEPADFLHVVMEGTVELFARWADRESTMEIVRPVGTFILAACIRDAPYLMSARTLERARIVLVPATDLRAVFQRDNAFALSTIQELAQRYRAVVRHAKDVKLRNARERIAAYLLVQSARVGHLPGFVLPVEKRVLASHLGMTPENLSRALRALEDHGVKVDGMRVIITDRAKLTALARPDPLIDGSVPQEAPSVKTRGVGSA